MSVIQNVGRKRISEEKTKGTAREITVHIAADIRFILLMKQI